MKPILVVEIIISAALIFLILMQARGGELGGIFGGWGMPTYRTRRGIERVIFRSTIALGIIFVLLSALSARLGS